MAPVMQTKQTVNINISNQIPPLKLELERLSLDETRNLDCWW